MRAWLLQGRPGDDGGGLEPLLRLWTGRPENSHWQVELRLANSSLAAEVKSRQPEVLVVAESVCPAGPWMEELLTLGTSLVVASLPSKAEAYRALAERYPVILVPVPPAVDGLGLALVNAQAAGVLWKHWRSQLEQMQHRLNDRIITERAKGILVQRLRISEEEAYRRLRLLSRRQRRPIRDIAQSLLDTQELLLPEMNGFLEDHRSDEPDIAAPVPPPREGLQVD